MKEIFQLEMPYVLPHKLIFKKESNCLEKLKSKGTVTVILIQLAIVYLI